MKDFIKTKVLFKILILCLIISSCIPHELDQQVDQFMRNVEIKKPENEYNRKVSEIFSVSFPISHIDYFEFLRGQIRKIATNPEGRKLLDLANQLFEAVNLLKENAVLGTNSSKLLIIFCDESSSFQGRAQNDLELGLKLNLIANKIFWHDELGLCTLIPAPCNIITKIDGQHQLVYITSCADPFYMLIAHELIHMTHFLQSYINDYCKNFLYTGEVIDISRLEQLKEKLHGHNFNLIDTFHVISQTTSENINRLDQLFQDKTRFHVKYKKGLTTSPRDFTKSYRKYLAIFPELHDQLTCRQSFTELCDKVEERQTVVGKDLSELTIRLAGGLPIRYIYQSSEDNTYEDLNVLLAIIQQTTRGKTFTSNSIVSYILNPKNAKFFDTRLFHKQINHKLLSDQLFNDFNLSEDKEKIEKIELEINDKQIRLPTIKTKTKNLLLEVIGDFEKEDITVAPLDKLFDRTGKLPIPIIRTLTTLGMQIKPTIKKSELELDGSKLMEFKSQIISLKSKLTTPSMPHDVSQQMPISPAMPHTTTKDSSD